MAKLESLKDIKASAAETVAEVRNATNSDVPMLPAKEKTPLPAFG